MHIGFFGADAEMAHPDSLSHALEEWRRVRVGMHGRSFVDTGVMSSIHTEPVVAIQKRNVSVYPSVSNFPVVALGSRAVGKSLIQ